MTELHNSFKWALIMGRSMSAKEELQSTTSMMSGRRSLPFSDILTEKSIVSQSFCHPNITPLPGYFILLQLFANLASPIGAKFEEERKQLNNIVSFLRLRASFMQSLH